MQPNRTATDYPAESVFPKFAPRTSTHFFMLSTAPRLALLRAGEAGRGPLGERAPARRPGGCDHQFTGFHGRGSSPFQIPAIPQGATPGPASNSTNLSRALVPNGRRSGGFRGLSGPSGSGSAGLHAKTFAFDRRIGFIGSYNLDPRSSKLNTEMGVLFDCPELVKRLAEATGRDIDRYAYRVELVGNPA
jgi:phosphatidylserine/phosphatidylglycerophosphate/cardiolipin synthase-like enzyme